MGRGFRQLKQVLSILSLIHFHCTLASDSFPCKSVANQYQLKERAKDDAKQNTEKSLKDTLKPTGADRTSLKRERKLWNVNVQVNTRHLWKISTPIVCRYFLEISLEGPKIFQNNDNNLSDRKTYKTDILRQQTAPFSDQALKPPTAEPLIKATPSKLRWCYWGHLAANTGRD